MSQEILAPKLSNCLSVMGAVAGFERALIRERQRESVALAKAQGNDKGRKQILGLAAITQLQARAAAGAPKAQLARELGISRETLYRYLRRD